MLAPIAAGVATLSAATSVTSVVAGSAWFGYVFVAVLLIAAAGLALRSLQAPTVVVGLGQVLVLLFLITGAFTTHGIAGIIPGTLSSTILPYVMRISCLMIELRP